MILILFLKYSQGILNLYKILTISRPYHKDKTLNTFSSLGKILVKSLITL